MTIESTTYIKPGTGLRQAMSQRLLLLDGGMGTEVQRHALDEQQWRGTALQGLARPIKGNIDALVLSQPQIITAIHESYLEAGADVIETCTFNAQRISQDEYGMADYVRAINGEAARLARAAADKYTALTGRQRYVLGSVGPTNKMLSMSADVNRPEARALDFDAMASAYLEQMDALIAGGVDGLLIETIFDTLSAKAAIHAAQQAMANTGRQVELLLSITISDSSGRMLCGQTIEAFAASVRHAAPLALGLNCSLGATAILPHAQALAEAAPWAYITAHPNAGLPNELGEYEDGPDQMAAEMQAYLKMDRLGMMGGCCGTTPAHISALRSLIDNAEAAPRASLTLDTDTLELAGLEPLRIADTFVNVGERCNVAGSRKFLRLIKEKKYDEALEIARQQAQDGAMAIDINMDDGMLEAADEMETFLRLLASDPEIARLPIMIDSSNFAVIERALKNIAGKAIVNSISLKEGEDTFLAHARTVRGYGAAVIVMAFDEQGQATTYDRKVQVCQRAYRLLTEKAGFNPADIIFDPNILTVATGMADDANHAQAYVDAAQWIRQNLPGARVSGGLSNLSFAFRGNNYVREAMHAVFLYHAISHGMNMAIMNPATAVRYEDIPATLRDAIYQVLFGTRDEAATEQLVTLADQYRDKKDSADATATAAETALTAPERLRQALIQGNPATINADLDEMLADGATPLDIISGPLMEGMNEVGRQFGEGKMFLPQVVKTARTMKMACEVLFARDEMAAIESGPTNGTLLLATVKGDVHDIGKNIVGVVLACNGYKTIDLGVMTPPEKILATAREQAVDIVCLSGLITPSLHEMCRVATMMEEAGMTLPLLIGGATTSALHTAVKIAPLYPSGVVVHVRDAAHDPQVAAMLLNADTRQDFIAQVKAEQQQLRDQYAQRHQQAQHAPRAEKQPLYTAPAPPHMGARRQTNISIDTLIPYIDWRYFYHAWKVKADSAEGASLRHDADLALQQMAATTDYHLQAITGFYHSAFGDESVRLSVCDCGCDGVAVPLPRGRQGESLADYPSTTVGAFAVTISPALAEKIEALKGSSDTYQALLWQSLADRLAEAASEYLHQQVQQSAHWQGIRPAAGYPALPDHTAIFQIDKLLTLANIGITLTENGAMYPQASVAGLYIPHPQAKYVDARKSII